MNNGRFKAIMLFALIMPLLVSFAGYLLYYPSQGKSDNVAATTPDTELSGSQEMQVAGTERDLKPQENNDLGFRELIVYLALVAGLTALLGYYLNKATLLWICVVILPLIFTILFVGRTGMELSYFYIPTLLFTAGVALITRYLFYNSRLIRFRMILCSVLGAGLLTLYLRSLYYLTKSPFPQDQWSALFISGLIMFVFVTFGLSLSDMVIMRVLAKGNKSVEPDPDEDEESDD